MQKNADLLNSASPAAKNLKQILHPFIARLDTGRFIGRVSALFREAYHNTGKMNFSSFTNYEFQPYKHHLGVILSSYHVAVKKDEVVVEIPINDYTMQRLNNIVTEYYFDAILVYGDPTRANGLRIESETSPYYKFGGKPSTCRLSVILPSMRTSWMVILKAACMEGKEPAAHPRHYGMKVVMVGEKK